jgi:2-polyprenyl-3-methyl-5-hydroxy-6-metoxy-1,4-benzoquinol methylase
MSAHIYQREVNLDSGDSLALIARRIPRGSKVLELGVATGYFSRFLSKELDCVVDGVEYDPVMAAEAGRWCRQLLQGDLEQERLASHFSAGAYDVVVAADVLEHLYDPGLVLAQLPELLAPGGKVVISVPNVAYGGLILDLIEGNFEYRDEGLLDRTHIRFYTRATFVSLLESHGLVAESIEPVLMALEHSEFYGRLERYPVPLKNYIFARPDAGAYQFVIEARPAGV